MNRKKFDNYCRRLGLKFSCSWGAGSMKSCISTLRYYKYLKENLENKAKFRLRHKWINNIPFITPLSYILTAKQLLDEHFQVQPNWLKRELNI